MDRVLNVREGAVEPRRKAVEQWRVMLVGATKRSLLYGVVIILSLLFAAPLLWMVSTSLKTDPQIYRVPPTWIPNPARFVNYPEALTRAPFLLFLSNTLQYAVFVIIGVLISNSLVAYGFSRIEWPGRDVLFFVFLSAMMIPYQVRMIPLYITFKNIGWINSYKPLIVPSFFGAAYYIFLLRQFFFTIPSELSDAARVDGCSELGIYFRIILPLSKPVLAVIALLRFQGAWNEYLMPLIYLNRESLYPLALGLQQLRDMYYEELMWPRLMAACTVVALPPILIFYLTQRTFVEGISITGIKG